MEIMQDELPCGAKKLGKVGSSLELFGPNLDRSSKDQTRNSLLQGKKPENWPTSSRNTGFPANNRNLCHRLNTM